MNERDVEIEALSAAEKRALLREMMARRGERVEAEHPASAGQRALWFLQGRDPDSVAYNVIVAASLREPVEVAALQAALHELIVRHAALRTSYQLRGGTLLQVVARAAPQALVVVDVAGCDDAALRERIEADAHRPFVLATGPVLRACLYTRAADDHVLLLVVHHIAIDGTAMEVLLAELRELYLHLAHARPAPAWRGTPGGSFADYAAWERTLLAGPDSARLWRYWEQTLADAGPPLTLPLTRMPGQPAPDPALATRPPLQRQDGAERVYRLDADVAAALREFVRTRRVTLYTVVLAALFALLRRYTGQGDLCVGSFIAQRPRKQFERAVGYYINTVPLRAWVEPGAPFAALTGQVEQIVLAALDHMELPFAALVERLAPARDPSRSPLFDVALNQIGPVQFANFTGLDLGASTAGAGEPFTLVPYAVRRRFARFDLEITLGEGPAGIALYFQYNTGVLDRATIDCMMAHLQQLLRGALRRPDAPLASLELLTAPERAALARWNAAPVAPGPAVGLHDGFVARARRTPEAIAVRRGGEALSYRELDARAETIAAELQRRGVGPEVVVAVCVERSLALLPALLGVLKAGGAYVPIDPAYPQARVQAMIEDSGAALVLTTARTDAMCSALAPATLRIDGPLPPPDANFRPPPIEPDRLAYMIYTSGSTGRPKGVEVRHGSCAALLRWAAATFPADDFRATLASTSICFDVSVFELFHPLAVGGSLVLVDTPLDLADLGATEVTCVITVPSVMAALVELPDLPRSLRSAYLAGEPLRRALVDRIRARTPITDVYNLYGPTENTVYSTWCEVSSGDPDEPTIGRPIAGCRAHVLDAALQPAPLLHVGELCLGGAGVARGYHARPELTAERFVPDPFTDDRQARLYRTGDLARVLPDGRIELLGRRDAQIKLHGYRIELGEIEAALARHPGVLESAVRVQERRGDRRLVGYVSPTAPLRDDPDGLREQLRAHLEQILPAYMVPPVLVVLPALPHTPNGKVDRAGLPEPEERATLPAPAAAAPRGPIAAHVATVWSELLQVPVEAIGDHDTFFALGGHSLLLAQVAQALSLRLGRRVGVADLFQHRDIAAISTWLERQVADDPSAVQSAEDRAQQRRGALARLRRAPHS